MRYNQPYIKKTTRKGGLFTYWVAGITFHHKRYQKTFSYNEEGYKEAEKFIKSIRDLYTFELPSHVPFNLLI